MDRLPNVLGLLVVLLVGVAATVVPDPAAPLGADAPPSEFSAARAAEHIDVVAAEPRPLASPGHTAARDYLVRVLDDLGWDTTVQEGVGWFTPTDSHTRRGARLSNVVATLAGTDPTGTVVLAAHYDTVTASPGASDDGIGVGTVLETARALTDGERPRNNVVVLVTDGEERGLLGAQLFTTQPPPFPGPMVVLNHEARGNAGMPLTFRISSPNADLVRILAQAPDALADSFTQTAFEALPNDTDFRRFDEAGLHGYDTAIAGGSAYYHTPLDTPDRLSRSSLQQMGDVALATALTLGATDLTALGGGTDIVATTPWGLLYYPRWMEVALTLVLAVAVAVLAVVRIRRRDASAGQIGRATGVALVAAVAAGGAAFLPWWMSQRVVPGLGSVPISEPYRTGFYQLAAVVAAVGVLTTAYVAVRRRFGAPAFAVGALVVVTLVALAALPFMGIASPLVLPALPAVLGVLVAEAIPQRSTWWRTVVVVAGLLPAALVTVPAVLASFDAGLMFGAPLAGAFVAVLFALLLPLTGPLLPDQGAVPIAVLTVFAVVGCTLLGGYTNRAGATAPRQEEVFYSLDADHGEAVWASPDRPRSDWSADLLTESPAPLPDYFPWRPGTSLAHGPAPIAPLEPPRVDVLDDAQVDGGRVLQLRLSSPRGAATLGLWVEGATVREAIVDGAAVEPGADFGFLYTTESPDGIEVRLDLETTGPADEVEVRVADLSGDLAVVPGYTPPDGKVVVGPIVAVTRTVVR
ncbi:M28 family peptidase [Rhodococcus sp. HM1]|uniref:M28 family peptidase n=1 Tax=Rhodococcus sp. HM1 TaxID=2937759 RepID=UPI00200A9F69|nr:M28 family peptidase [Rhodococcus sp. HM1]MCK8674171.1 M28 family peptidase [Rhodococcus sp. HM1]